MERDFRSTWPKPMLSLHESSAITIDFKHRAWEVFTSSDVSFPNVVIIFGCRYFAKSQILVWMAKGDSFKSYLSNISIEHVLNTIAEGM